MNPLLYAKLAAALVLGAGLAYAGYHVADLKGKAALESLQHDWDMDRESIQKVTDTAIAQATKERDTALQANEVISNDYQARIDAANSNAANFASRLRNALAATANRGSTDKTADNPEAIAARAAAVAQQLGQVVGLTAGLYADCKANADQLDALIEEIRPQL